MLITRPTRHREHTPRTHNKLLTRRRPQLVQPEANTASTTVTILDTRRRRRRRRNSRFPSNVLSPARCQPSVGRKEETEGEEEPSEGTEQPSSPVDAELKAAS